MLGSIILIEVMHYRGTDSECKDTNGPPTSPAPSLQAATDAQTDRRNQEDAVCTGVMVVPDVEVEEDECRDGIQGDTRHERLHRPATCEHRKKTR